jgi:hypothetical protein
MAAQMAGARSYARELGQVNLLKSHEVIHAFDSVYTREKLAQQVLIGRVVDLAIYCNLVRNNLKLLVI